MPPKAAKRRPTQEEKCCPICGNIFNARGYGMHQKSCKGREEERFAPAIDAGSIDPEPSNDENLAQAEIAEIAEIAEDPDTEDVQGPGEPIKVGSGPNTRTPKDGEIVIEYHPHSEKVTRILTPEEFKETLIHHPVPMGPLDDEPWRPFASREDFDFAELTHDAKLSRPQIDRFIKLIQRCQEAPGSFTLTSFNDLKGVSNRANNLLTQFQRHEIVSEFEGKKKSYETWCRPLWDWITDHLIDPELVQQFEWDAQKIFKFKDGNYTQIFTEPWTGKRFWDVQSSLPKDTKPVCLELYADKSKLSSFGTAKGYPVMARILNLPVKIRNGEGIGGARVVGWLPIVEDSQDTKHRPGWVNFKNAIWHKSFYKLLESIETYSFTGCWVMCGDGIRRMICPLILILAADYEEQSVMALIRGLNSLCPCTRCLIPKMQQGDLTKTATLRTAVEMKALVLRARQIETRADEEEEGEEEEEEDILKSNGLRDVDNVFWRIKNSDPYAALSFDRLHNFPGGLFHGHLWKTLKMHVEASTRRERTEIDNMANSVPRWRGLNHFVDYLAVDFSDGTKWEDISKICVLVTRNTIGEDDQGRHLLRAIRAYVELDILASFNVHTDTTIKLGRDTVRKFSKLANEYKKDFWNYPKMHSIQHLFDDIEAKGVTRNYTTKTFEKMHGPLGETYERVTNFKNVGSQILKVEHNDLVLQFIRSQITRFDDFHKGTEDAVSTETTSETYISGMERSRYIVSPGTNHATILGSKQKTTTIEVLLEQMVTDVAFTSFCSRISQTIQALSLTPTDTIAISDSHQITEFRYLKVKYESGVDWDIKTNYLRCSPEFSGNPRYDFVIANLPQGRAFAQLVFIFVCRVGGRDYRLGLVQPLAKVSRANAKKVDKELSIYRWQIRSRARCEVIPVDSIVRGAVLIKDTIYNGDYFVMDTLDEDMYLRVKQLR